MIKKKIKQEKNEIRYPFELKLLNKAKEIEPTDIIDGWEKIVIPAGGIIAGGWTADGNVLLISSSEYSVTSVRGECIERQNGYDLIRASLNNDNLHFEIPSNKEIVSIFGLDAGDGVYCNSEGWRVEIIYPWWPRATVTLKNIFDQSYRLDEYLDNTYVLNIERLDGWLKCGFSQKGDSFMVLGSGGAEVYKRKK